MLYLCWPSIGQMVAWAYKYCPHQYVQIAWSSDGSPQITVEQSISASPALARCWSLLDAIFQHSARISWRNLWFSCDGVMIFRNYHIEAPFMSTDISRRNVVMHLYSEFQIYDKLFCNIISEPRPDSTYEHQWWLFYLILVCIFCFRSGLYAQEHLMVYKNLDI